MSLTPTDSIPGFRSWYLTTLDEFIDSGESISVVTDPRRRNADNLCPALRYHIARHERFADVRVVSRRNVTYLVLDGEL